MWGSFLIPVFPFRPPLPRPRPRPHQILQHVAGATGALGWRAQHTAPGTSNGKLATWSPSTAPLPRPAVAPTPCGSFVMDVASCVASSPGSWFCTQSLWWYSSCCCLPKTWLTASSTGWSSTHSLSSPSPLTPRPCAQTRLVPPTLE